jgi:hypothetical protein
MADQVTDTRTESSRWGWLYKISAAAALAAGLLLLIGMISLILSVVQPASSKGWLLLANNWLVVIFKLHAEFSDVRADALHSLNLLDMLFLFIVGLISLSLATVFTKTRRVWSIIVAVLSLLGMVLYFATQLAGRSTVMLGVLILSLVMLGNKFFSNAIVYSGILAGILLLVGDLTVGIRSDVITIFFGIGYVLLIIWFFLVARVFFRLGSKVSKEKIQ